MKGPIVNLARESGIWFIDETNREEMIGDFAELIVQECVWQVVKDDAVPQDIQILIGKRIKEHFGIEK